MSGDLVFWYNSTERTAFSTISNIVYTLLTLVLVVVSIISIILTRRLSQSQLKFQTDLKKQDLEQWVLREDIFVTVIPVFSSDWFSKLKHKKASWKNGLLKVSKHHVNMWEYFIIDPVHYTNWDTWEKLWSQERELEYSTRDTEFKWWFNTKYSCIEYAMTYHNLTSSYIEFTNSKWFNFVYFTE